MSNPTTVVEVEKKLAEQLGQTGENIVQAIRCIIASELENVSKVDQSECCKKRDQVSPPVEVDRNKAWLTSREAAVLLGIKVKTLWNWVSKGKITPRKYKGSKRGRNLFLRAEVEVLIRR